MLINYSLLNSADVKYLLLLSNSTTTSYYCSSLHWKILNRQRVRSKIPMALEYSNISRRKVTRYRSYDEECRLTPSQMEAKRPKWNSCRTDPTHAFNNSRLPLVVDLVEEVSRLHWKQSAGQKKSHPLLCRPSERHPNRRTRITMTNRTALWVTTLILMKDWLRCPR